MQEVLFICTCRSQSWLTGYSVNYVCLPYPSPGTHLKLVLRWTVYKEILCVHDWKCACAWKTCLQSPLVCGVAVCSFVVWVWADCGESFVICLFWKGSGSGWEWKGEGPVFIVSDVLGNLVMRENLIIGFSFLVEKQANMLCLLLILSSKVLDDQLF